MLLARCDVIVEAKTAVKIVVKRERNEKGVEIIFRRCSFGPGWRVRLEDAQRVPCEEQLTVGAKADIR